MTQPAMANSGLSGSACPGKHFGRRSSAVDRAILGGVFFLHGQLGSRPLHRPPTANTIYASSSLWRPPYAGRSAAARISPSGPNTASADGGVTASNSASLWRRGRCRNLHFIRKNAYFLFKIRFAYNAVSRDSYIHLKTRERVYCVINVDQPQMTDQIRP